jgi:hypothetical protein
VGVGITSFANGLSGFGQDSRQHRLRLEVGQLGCGHLDGGHLDGWQRGRFPLLNEVTQRLGRGGLAQFAPQNANVFGSFDADLHVLGSEAQDPNDNPVANMNHFRSFPSENEHDSDPWCLFDDAWRVIVGGWL